jgi:phospholipid-binding lipoprotein MlaA
MRSTTRISLLALCLLLLCGCASLPPGKRDPRDPWERFNRSTYKFNDVLDRAVVKPVAKGYTHLPQPMQTGVHNFFDNLNYPITIVNDLLQGQVVSFFSDIGRFVINTTAGLGGLFDPATAAGMEKNYRDFGQTLGKWGVPKGPYVVVPIFGPYTVRDGIGAATVDYYANPSNYAQFWVSTSLWLVRGVDRRARLLPLDATIQSAYDPYAFIRNAYLQNRDFLVTGGASQSEEEQERKLMEEAGQEDNEQTPPAAPPPQAPQPEAPKPEAQPQAPQSQAPQPQPPPPPLETSPPKP